MTIKNDFFYFVALILLCVDVSISFSIVLFQLCCGYCVSEAFSVMFALILCYLLLVPCSEL